MIDEKRLYRALGERLKALREQQREGKVTQASLARDVGLERTSITNIERGNQKVPLHVLYRICEVLQVPVNDVLPTLSDIKAAPVEATLEDLPFAGHIAKVTPLLKQRLAMLINAGNKNDLHQD